MTTWHEQPLNIKDMPSSDSAQLVGTYSEGSIKINVEYYQDGKQFVINEMTKDIKMWRSVEIINEEIEEKYWDKLSKIRAKHERQPFADWLPYLVSRLSESQKAELQGYQREGQG